MAGLTCNYTLKEIRRRFCSDFLLLYNMMEHGGCRRQFVVNGLHGVSCVSRVTWSLVSIPIVLYRRASLSYSSILLLLLYYVHSLLHSASAAQVRLYTIYYRFGIPNRYAMIIPLYTPLRRRAGLVFIFYYALLI